MAKGKKAKTPNNAENSEFSFEEAQKRLEKYNKSCETEKKWKAMVVSIISFAILCFIVILIIVLKSSGVGTTVVFDTQETQYNGDVDVYTSEDAQGTTLADYLVDKLVGNK